MWSVRPLRQVAEVSSHTARVVVVEVVMMKKRLKAEG
jgi:hypothetical protein